MSCLWFTPVSLKVVLTYNYVISLVFVVYPSFTKSGTGAYITVLSLWFTSVSLKVVLTHMSLVLSLWFMPVSLKVVLAHNYITCLVCLVYAAITVSLKVVLTHMSLKPKQAINCSISRQKVTMKYFSFFLLFAVVVCLFVCLLL